VTDFSIQVQAHRPSLNHDWIKTPVLDDLQEELNGLRNNPGTKRTDINEGDMFGVSKDASVNRVRIVKCLEKEKLASWQETHVIKFEVCHVDHGFKTVVESCYLLDLPDHLKQYPDLAVRSFVTGLKPTDNLISWYEEDIQFVKDQMANVDFMTGWIYFSSGDLVWLDGFKLHYNFENLKHKISKTCIDFNSYIIKKERAVAATKIPYTNALFDAEQVKWSHVFDVQEKYSQQSFLTSGDELEQVNLVHFKDLDDLYVRHHKFENCLKTLETDISKSTLKPLTDIRPGLVCLQKYSDDSFNRVRIIKISACGRLAETFYLDYGETWDVDIDTLFHLDLRFLKRLPFQAIRCKLADYGGQVSPDDVYDATRFPDNQFKILFSKKLPSEDKHLSLVVLYVKTEEEEKDIIYNSLGKVLFDSGFNVEPVASFTGDDKLTIKRPIVQVADTDDNDDEDDDMKDILESEKQSREKMAEIISNSLQRCLPKTCEPGFVARRLGAPDDDEQEDPDDEEIRANQLQKVSLPDYQEGMFESSRGWMPTPVVEDEDDDVCESDDDLDIDSAEQNGFEHNITWST